MVDTEKELSEYRSKYQHTLSIPVKSIAILTCVTALILIGCNNEKTAAVQSTSQNTNPAPKVGEKIAFDNSSPDLAIKSWWKFMDLKRQEDYARCQDADKNFPRKYVSYTDKVAQADIARYVKHDPECQLEVIKREIQEVKVETETRAIVFAKLFNATPIPAGGKPSEYDSKRRADGYNYKYLLEKSPDGWKVSQIYEYRDYLDKNSPWKAIDVDSFTSPRVASLIFGVE